MTDPLRRAAPSRQAGAMKTLAILSAAAATLAGCTAPEPHAPVRDPLYTAIGAEPFWLLTIGEERIVLSFPRKNGGFSDMRYRRGAARLENGVRRWEGGSGTAVISVEAWQAACRTGGNMFEERVRVRLSGRELNGCGGRPAVNRVYE
jgi:uncharacterized membrane protein